MAGAALLGRLLPALERLRLRLLDAHRGALHRLGDRLSLSRFHVGARRSLVSTAARPSLGARSGTTRRGRRCSGAALVVGAYNKPQLALLGLPRRWCAAWRGRGARGAASWIAGAAVAGSRSARSRSRSRRPPRPTSESSVGVRVETSIACRSCRREPGARATRSRAAQLLAVDLPAAGPRCAPAAQSRLLLRRPPHRALPLRAVHAALPRALPPLRAGAAASAGCSLAGLAGVALFALLWIPFNWHGGGGFVGNRYFVNALPGFLFLVGRIAPPGDRPRRLRARRSVRRTDRLHAVRRRSSAARRSRRTPATPRSGCFPFEETLRSPDPGLSRHRRRRGELLLRPRGSATGRSAMRSGSSAGVRSGFRCARSSRSAVRSSRSRPSPRRTACGSSSAAPSAKRTSRAWSPEPPSPAWCSRRARRSVRASSTATSSTTTSSSSTPSSRPGTSRSCRPATGARSAMRKRAQQRRPTRVAWWRPGRSRSSRCWWGRS